MQTAAATASVSSPMEVICTDSNLILQPLQKGDNNVWVSRSTGRFEVRPAWDLAGQDNPECLGIVWGLVGKLKIHQGGLSLSIDVSAAELTFSGQLAEVNGH